MIIGHITYLITATLLAVLKFAAPFVPKGNLILSHLSNCMCHCRRTSLRSTVTTYVGSVHVSLQHTPVFFLHREGNESGPRVPRGAIKAKRCISDKSHRTVAP